MTLIQTKRCDQCGDEALVDSPASADWHAIHLHDFTTSAEAHVDLCADCYRSASVPALLEGQRRALVV